MKRSGKYYLWAIVLVLILGLSMLPGCSGDDGDGDGHVIATYTVELYFINTDYAITGDESLEHYLVDTREFSIPADENPWIMILEDLKNVEPDFAETAVTNDVVFNDVYLDAEDDSLIVVDFESLSSGGSMQEGFLIGQIVNTIVKNSHIFMESNNVDKVQFLVKGEKVESLMGHFDATEPFTIQNDE